MKKVAIITNIPAPYRVDLFYYMQTHFKEYEFHIIYTNKNEDNRMWNIDNSKLINTHILESKILKIKGKLDTRYIHVPYGIRKELKRINPDVVIGFEYNISAIISMLWSKKHKKKYINLTDGTLFSERNIGFIQKFLRKTIIKKSDAYIASSSKAKEKLLYWGAKENKIHLAMLTIDIDKMKTNKEKKESDIILYVGSMIKRKGLDLLIEALPLINADYKLRIVGNGKESEIRELKEKANIVGVKERIEWIGFKTGNELKEEYINSKFFVLPTREDCFGLVLLEAMCTNTPIVSSKYADGAYDIIEEGVNGFIIDPYDKESFAAIMEKVLLSDNIYLNSREYNSVHLSKFEFENVSRQIIKAINN